MPTPSSTTTRDAAAAARRGRRRVPTRELEPKGHTTTPPARYTEASLVKRLEELGIGRPSTYASIMQTIQDRGYVWKKGQALVPTWTAFAVVNLLEQHFDDLVDYAFTATMEDDLDAIAATRSQQAEPWLGRVLLRRRRARPACKRLVRGEPRRDRRRGDQHDPDRARRRRRRGRGEARPLRART